MLTIINMPKQTTLELSFTEADFVFIDVSIYFFVGCPVNSGRFIYQPNIGMTSAKRPC